MNQLKTVVDYRGNERNPVEQNPFANNSESDDNDWEVSPEDLELDDDSEETEEKPKRRSLFESAKDRKERETQEAEEEGKKQSIFEKLLSGDDEEKEPENGDEEPEVEESSFLNPVVKEPLVETAPATPDEVTQEFEQVVEDKIEEIDDAIVHESEPTHVGELLADASLLENVADKMDEGQDPVKAIENATEETLENPLLDAEPEEVIAEVEPAATVEEIEPEAVEPEPVVTVEDEPEDPVTTPTAPVPPTLSTPTPPIPTAAEYNQYASSAPEATTSSTDEELEPMNDSYNRDPKTGQVLAAGLVGYALGRRGGRKRTEEKLQPVITEQERTIDDLNDQLEASEEAVRKAALQQAESEKSQHAEQEEHLKKQEELEQEVAAANAETIQQEKAEFEEREKQLEEQLDQEATRTAQEAEQLQKEQEELKILREQEASTVAAQEAEEMTTILNRAEAEEEKRQERTKAVAFAEQKEKEKAEMDRLRQARAEQDAQTMPLAKVLETAEFIPMKGGMSLRQLYESKRIDAVNLRRVVNEYNRGGNYELVLERSLEAVEMRSELKHEVKQDNSIYKQPEKAARTVADGIIASTGEQTSVRSEVDGQRSTTSSSTTDNLTNNPITVTEEPGLVISNATAIILGILAGIVIVLLVMLYSGVF